MEAMARRIILRGPGGECSAARLAPAVAHPLAFEREHLQSYFGAGLSSPLVLVHAPAGYGKTTALSFLARDEGASARWATLSEDDRDLDAFLATLMSSMYEWEVERAAPSVDVRDAASLILGAIEELGVTTLILDDYETVASSEPINALMPMVLEGLPAYVRVAIGTEVVPDFVRRLRLRQSLVELDRSDLHFDADDVATYLRDFHHYTVPDGAAASIARRADGCASVVNLVGQLVNNLPRYLRVDFDALPLGTGDQNIAMLLREVFARNGVPPARAAQTLRDAGIALADGATPAEALLDMLASRHCLAHFVATEPRAVVPHRLLRRLAPLL